MTTNPTTVDMEVYRLIGRFMSDVIVGIYKVMQDQAASITDRSNDNIKVLFLAKYLNSCWGTLATSQFNSKNGQHIKRAILDEIRPYLPNESPRCLMYLFYNIGLHVINNVVVDDLSGTGDAIAQECAKMAYLYFKQRGEHTCTACKWDELHGQSPAPIWELKKVAISGETSANAPPAAV